MTKRGRLNRKLRRNIERTWGKQPPGAYRNGYGKRVKGMLRHIGMDFILTLKRRIYMHQHGESVGFSDKELRKLGPAFAAQWKAAEKMRRLQRAAK